MERFREFCKIDLQLTESTIRSHMRFVKKLVEEYPDLSVLKVDDIRHFLSSYQLKSKPTYANCVKALRVFFRDFLNSPEAVSTFKLPRIPFKPKQIPSRDELIRFYQGLQNLRDKALFLTYCSTGLRGREVLELKISDLNMDVRAIIPNTESSTTKRRWVSFFNEETEKAIRKYLQSRVDDNPRLFPVVNPEMFRRKINGVKLNAQLMRDWFCCEMGRLGVQDRYVDAFCGRVPQSVLARHYTDYSPKRLKEIYDKISLKILS